MEQKNSKTILLLLAFLHTEKSCQEKKPSMQCRPQFTHYSNSVIPLQRLVCSEMIAKICLVYVWRIGTRQANNNKQKVGDEWKKNHSQRAQCDYENKTNKWRRSINKIINVKQGMELHDIHLLLSFTSNIHIRILRNAANISVSEWEWCKGGRKCWALSQWIGHRENENETKSKWDGFV